jgi:Fic family protein
VIDASEIGELTSLSSSSAYKLIADLEKFAILKEVTGGKRGKMYVFDKYLRLFN